MLEDLGEAIRGDRVLASARLLEDRHAFAAVPNMSSAPAQGIGPERLPEPVAVEVHRLERQPCATAPASAASRARGTAPPARRGAPRIQAVEHGRATIR